jgi:hypothetical protein
LEVLVDYFSTFSLTIVSTMPTQHAFGKIAAIAKLWGDR